LLAPLRKKFKNARMQRRVVTLEGRDSVTNAARIEAGFVLGSLQATRSAYA
jgi:hypothetical protein